MTTGARSASASSSPTTRYQVRWPSRSRWPSMAATYRSAAPILRRAVASGARPAARPPLAALPRRVESARDVGDEVGGVLDAGAEADVALAHRVGPPARPALRARVQSPEARRLGHERQRREERLRALGALQREADDRADAGPGEGGAVGGGAQRVGHCGGFVLLALEAHRERRQRAVREPRL